MALSREGDPMPSPPSIDERVAYLEGKVEDHYGTMSELRADLREVRTEVRDLRVEMNQRFEAMGARLEGKIDALSTRIDTKFTWLVGTQVAMLIALIGALLRR
jgi:predicted nuclease with TOPRIM domain